MRIRSLCIYMNKNHKKYQHTYQRLNIIFTKHYFTILQLLKIEKCHHIVPKPVQNMKLATAWQPCDNITDNFKLFKLDGSSMQTNKNFIS
jgi:hypothetical protein